MMLTNLKPNESMRLVTKKILIIGACLYSSTIDAAAPAGYTMQRADPEVAERHRYDGISVLREMTSLRHWQNAANPGPEFTDTVRAERDGPIEGHVGRTVVYAIPIRTQNALIQRNQRNQYTGLYQYRSDLSNANRISFGPLFYRPEGSNAIYHIKVTQQRWERVDGTVVDFLIASYKQDEKLRFLATASTQENLILNDHLPEPGLYVLVSLDNDPNPQNVAAIAQAAGAQAVPAPVAAAADQAPPAADHVPAIIKRWEKWKRLEPDASRADVEERDIIIRVASGVLSIPGVGLFARNQIVNGGEDQVARLREMIAAADAAVQEILTTPNAQGGAVIVTGPTKCGKTSFINCYAGNPCQSRERADGKGFEYYFPQPIDNLLVGYGSRSQTARPAFFADIANRILVVDNPGDEDTSGPLIDVVNAYMAYKMFQHPNGVKLVQMIDEARMQNDDSFIKMLQSVVNSCPNEDILRNMMHLMVSKHQTLGVMRYLRSLIGNPAANPAIDPNPLLEDKPAVARLIQYLVDNPRRVSTFPMAPPEEGPCQPNLVAARASLLDGPFVVHPPVALKIKKSALHTSLIKDFSKKLNTDMVRYLRTEGAQQIFSYCLKQIDEHNRPVAELRNELLNLVLRLRNISRDSTPEQFLEFFDGVEATATRAAVPKLFDAAIMRDIVANLKFLQTILPDSASCDVSDWKNALRDASPEGDTLGKIEILAKAPDVTLEDSNNTLRLNGLLIGCSDIEREIASRQIDPKRIIIRAFNTWFIDQNMTHNSTCIDAIAPRWKVTSGNKVIDISGVSGAQGANGTAGTNAAAGVAATAGGDGAPGSPGKTAGSFFGKLCDPNNLASLTIKANGGQGGNGGAGGTGGAGRNAGNGVEASMVEVPGGSGGDVCIIPWGDHPHENTAGPWYNHRLYFNVDDRNRLVGHLATWIGQAFPHQTWIYGHVRAMQHAPLGDAGMNGGRGGKKGLGGNAGNIVILGGEAIQREATVGAVAASDGTSGNGGAGGSNGNVLSGIRWTDCRAQNWQSGDAQYRLYALTDRWHPEHAPAHSAPAAANAANGIKPVNADGTDTLSDTNPTAADAAITIDQAAQDSKVNEYRTEYREQANNPSVSPFIRAFPGLE